MRELAKRTVPKKLVPVFVLPTQFLGDFFGERFDNVDLIISTSNACAVLYARAIHRGIDVYGKLLFLVGVGNYSSFVCRTFKFRSRNFGCLSSSIRPCSSSGTQICGMLSQLIVVRPLITVFLLGMTLSHGCGTPVGLASAEPSQWPCR